LLFFTLKFKSTKLTAPLDGNVNADQGGPFIFISKNIMYCSSYKPVSDPTPKGGGLPVINR